MAETGYFLRYGTEQPIVTYVYLWLKPSPVCSILPDITVFAVLLFLSYSRIVIFEARKLVIFLIFMIN